MNFNQFFQIAAVIFFSINFSLAQDFREDTYYRLTTKWQGDDKSLDIINDGKNITPQLAKTGKYSGQAWKITKVGADTYTLTTQWRGPEMKLDCIQGPNQNRPVLNKSKYSGSAWKITSIGGGYYKITNSWLSDRSLDIINDGKNNKIQVAKTGNYTGQMWKITDLNPPASAGAINYGDVIHLQNGWNKFGGGYLDTRGYQRDYAKTGNFLCVSTATGSNRSDGSGSWKVMSATGKANGTPVLVGDQVHLHNQWNKNGGYLDTRGYQKDYAKTGNHLCVSTATGSNRDSGSGTWKITSATGSSAGTPVTVNSQIHLQNGWNRFRGGFLDTRGYQRDFAKTGNFLCVSTATVSNRDGGSGIWKVIKAESATKNHLKSGETLKAGERLTSANGKYILRMQKDDGHLCVYNYANGKQGRFVWGSGKHGFKNARLVMQTDGNLVVYNGSNAPKWNSETHPYYNSKFRDSRNKPVKLVLENNGSLKLYTSAGAVVWSNK